MRDSSATDYLAKPLDVREFLSDDSLLSASPIGYRS